MTEINSVRALIIDDEPLIRRALADYLAECGYDVAMAFDGADGLAKARAEQFDIVLVDLRMPHVDGLEVIATLKAEQPELPVVVVSGTGVLDDAIEAMRRGAWDYVTKPIRDMVEITVVVERVLDIAYLRAERARAEQALQKAHDELERRVEERTAELAKANVTLQAEIVERMRAEEEIRHRNRELALLNRASRALSATLDLDQVFATILEETRGLLGVAACSVWLLDPPSQPQADASQASPGELVCREAVGYGSDAVRGWRLAPGEGLAGWVVQKGESLIVSDAQTDTRHFGGVDQHIGIRSRSILSAPLQVKGDVIGALQVVDTEEDRFKSVDLAVVESLAATAAIAIENARMFAVEKQHVAELARALEQQQELDRLRSGFIQNVSHELRTPLAIARGHAELLESGVLGELEPEQCQSVTVIARRMRMLSKMMDDFAAIMDIEAGHLQRRPVDLAELVYDLLTDTQMRATVEQADLTLLVEVAPDVPMVSGDPIQLRRAVDNLLDNALKFTPAGGHIAVRLRQADESLTLGVSDTGIGVPDDQLDRIFDRFYQVDGSTTRRYGGTGLGLALVKEIVEAHGGQVTLQSVPDKGSTFVVTLPVLDDNEGQEQS